MGCCDTGLKDPKENKENENNSDKKGDNGKTKTILIWAIGIVILIGIFIWLR